VGYHVPSSDYDFLVLCDSGTYLHLARQVGAAPEATSVDRAVDKEQIQQRYGIEVDLAVYEEARVERSVCEFRDVVRWIWTHAKLLSDPTHTVERLQASILVFSNQLPYTERRCSDTKVANVPRR